MKIKIKNPELKVKIETEKLKPTLEDLEVTPSGEKQEFNHQNSDGYDKVTVNKITTESININPTTDIQQFSGLYGNIYVNAVTANIDSNINSSNIKSGVSILGVDGSVVELIGETKEVTPTSNTQNITPSEGKNGLTTVTVNPIPNEYIIPSGTVDITENGVCDVKNYEYANVTAAGGDTPVPDADVIFFDYDGTPVYTYTKEQFLALNTLPANPTHDGLTAQGWNWALDKAKEYVQRFGTLNIGQNYVTSNGETRIYITIDDSDLLTMTLNININGNAKIDWGDGESNYLQGSSLSTTLNATHTYSTVGSYIIKIGRRISFLPIPSIKFVGWNRNYNGPLSMILNDNNDKNNARRLWCITKIELGQNVTLDSRGLSGLKNCSQITIPNTLTDFPASCLNSYYSSESFRKNGVIVLPPNTTSLTNEGAIGGRNVVLNYGLTSYASNALSYYGSTRLTLPATITNFTGTRGEPVNIKRIIPGQRSSLWQYALSSDSKEKKARILDSVTAVTTECLMNNDYIEEVIFEGDITAVSRIGRGLFSLKKIYFLNNTVVPSLDINAVCPDSSTNFKIVVPDSLYESWISATNWANIASHIIKESDDN